MVRLNIVKINRVMMRIIMLRATLMEVPVVDLMSSKLFAKNANVFKVVQVVVQVRVQFKTSRLYLPLSKNLKKYLLRCLKDYSLRCLLCIRHWGHSKHTELLHLKE